jgi:hypothetical protein
MEGWIKLHRGLQEHWLWTEEREYSKAEAWLDLIMSANYKARSLMIKGKLIDCKRGQLAYSLETLSKRWNWNKSRVRRFLDTLKRQQMIDTQSETVTTLITICKYETYQADADTNDTQTKRRRNGGDTPATPREESKKVIKKEEDIDTCFSFDDFYEAYGKKVDGKKAEARYKKVSEKDRAKIKETLPAYVASTPDKQFRKSPAAYLNQEAWNNEIIPQNNLPSQSNRKPGFEKDYSKYKTFK